MPDKYQEFNAADYVKTDADDRELLRAAADEDLGDGTVIRTVSKRYAATEPDSTASASTTNGASASSGPTKAQWRSKSSTTTKRGNTVNTSEPIHPGEHLSEFIEELGISQYRLAKTIGVPPIRINAIIKHRRSITADTALRIGRALGTTPDYWLNLQRMYDIDVARNTTDVSNIEPLVEAAV